MSSSRFETELAPDPVLKACVRGVAFSAWLVGCIVLLLASGSQPAALRVFACLGWSALAAVEYWRWEQGVRQLQHLRFGAGGAIRGLFRNSLWHDLYLQQGSTFTQRFVWLRLAGGPGPAVGILLARARQDRNRWRRLQVLLRCGR